MLLEARYFHLRIVPKSVLSTTSSLQPSWLFQPLVQQLYEMFLWHVALLEAVLRHVKAARRVFFKADADPENEKYRANSLLTRLGFSGPEHKELRRVLMGHLSGYAAFKNEAGMRAHREKYARLRRERQAAKEGTEP